MNVSMARRRLNGYLCLVCVLACLAIPRCALAAESHGQVTLNGLPLPGATVTATQGEKKFATVSDEQGNYSFSDLPDGTWAIKIEMTGFTAMEQQVSVAPSAPATPWELKMLTVDAMIAQTKIVKAEPMPEALPQTPIAGAAAAPAKKATSASADTSAAPKPEESAAQSSDGFLVNGSVNNAATSQFTLAPAFGNNRAGSKSLYNGSVVMILDNSALDASPFSFTGLNTPKPEQNQITGGFTFGGPLNIPHFMPHGPNFFVAYQWTHNHTATTQPALVPTQAQQNAAASAGQAQAVLLALYPLPTPGLIGNGQYNYQASIPSNSHQDQMQSRLDKTFNPKNYGSAQFAFQSIRSNNSNIFNFVDTTDTLGWNGGLNWNHRFSQRYYLTTGYRVSRFRTLVRPYFEDRRNISGASTSSETNAGITRCSTTPTTPPTACGGNDQDQQDWGPPTLSFSSGIQPLTDVNSVFNRSLTNSFSATLHYYHGRHNFQFGGDYRRQEYNVYAQSNPRGKYTFTGAATGISDFADFLQGTPDTSSIAYGNADKYFRQSVYDAFANDDWKIRPELTINLGIRWDYGAPVTEKKDRLINLNVAPGFTAVTGQQYPNAKLQPDHMGFEPQIGIAWRPIPGSSVIIRAGYGIYDDTSVYQSTANNMAQQAPLSTSVNVAYDPTSCPETLQSGFNPCSSQFTAQNFGVDPHFRVGYAQIWNASIQRDLPAALQMTATYTGIKGTRGMQRYLPNTYALGGTAPACTMTPCSGFTYQSSGGDSTREQGSLQLRRRLRSGFTATLLYTYSKSIDDDSALGGQGPNATGASSTSTAQNWLDLSGERGLSTFDQRHLLNVQMQYTTGMGLGGGTLLNGWRGRAFKEWTFLSTLAVGSGLPETPIYFAVVPGSNSTGTIRPSLTGAAIQGGANGAHLNIAAYQTPQAGAWGNARRDSINGPSQFSLNATLQRTFRVTKRDSLTVQFVANNVLNRVVFTSWNTSLNSCTAFTDPGNPSCPAPALPGHTQNLQTPGSTFTTNANPLFGLPASTNGMRSLQTTVRLTF
jgi:hypothetical protein